MRLSRFDLNLLTVFEALMAERSVSRAAKRLALSQPATTHALNRLRALLDDQLFVRTPAGMEPTPRALQLAVPVRQALEGFQRALEPEAFSAATAERRFDMAVNNHAALVLATPILLACAAEAPGVRLHIRPAGTLPVADLLDRGELDFVIAARPLGQQRFASKLLMEDEFRIVLRADHPEACGPITLERFAAMPRIHVSSSGDDLAFVDQALADAGLPARTTGGVPYLALGSLLAGSDHVAVVRSQIAEQLARTHAVACRPLPLPNRRVASVLNWHARNSGHAAYGWFIELVARAARDFAEVAPG